MSGLLSRACGLFLEPAAARPPRPALVASSVAPAAGLVCHPCDAAPLGAAIALSLVGRRGSALVATWHPDGHTHFRAPHAPASRQARRLASSLTARGIEASASGRLTSAVLPPDPDDVGVAVERAAAATGVPLVIVVGGPRCPSLDAVLASLDVVCVAPPPEAGSQLTDLAVSGLAALGPPVQLCRPLSSPVFRALAVAGLAAPPGFRSLPRAVAAHARTI